MPKSATAIVALAVEPIITNRGVRFLTVEARSECRSWHYKIVPVDEHNGTACELTHTNGNVWIFKTLITARRWTYAEDNACHKKPYHKTTQATPGIDNQENHYYNTQDSKST